MKLLYLSCHSILEFNEVSMFHELGIDVFSPGSYLDPNTPGDGMRPGISTLKYDPEDVALWHTLAAPGIDNKERLTKEFVDRFDVVMVMHMPTWIEKNWEAMKHKSVIWRTIGQSLTHQEKQLTPYRKAGMKVVRYSPAERRIPSYLGEDAMIRFNCSPDLFKDWNGNTKQIMSISQDMIKRDVACNYTFFREVTKPFSTVLYGSGSEACEIGKGRVPFSDLVQALKDNAIYFYTGTHPASYTLNFMEALMTGIPIVAIGPGHGDASYFSGHRLYEVADILKKYDCGFASDDVGALQLEIKRLLEDRAYAESRSKHGRETAIKLFGTENIKTAWQGFFECL